ncbi:MAG: helix-turn-helix domain-containing protein [Oscillospiraceae bacterium]|nr:helix-turn-helix domain-containing protein [Oscillospiraceae bacterium]
MPNRLFQNMLKQIGGEIERTLGIADENGQIVACNVEKDPDELAAKFAIVAEIGESSGMVGDYAYKVIESKTSSDYYAFCEGADDAASGYCALLSTCFANMQQHYDDKYDKNSFVKNIIMDNILPGDVVFRARELHLPLDVRRVVYLVKFKEIPDSGVADILVNMFPDKSKDFIINIDHREIVLVKELKKTSEDKDFQKIAQSIVDTVGAEGMTNTNIGISNSVDSIQDLARAYREARIAIEVGKVFGSEKDVLSYSQLGIGRLIYQLPTTLCELFLNEIFKKESIDVLDDETLFTIQKFFENNLNVSETSRKLFVHRNTLVYRLDKIKKLTGLDLREFEDAIVFQVAVMVNKYLNSQRGY